jgi:hypothetical protein
MRECIFTGGGFARQLPLWSACIFAVCVQLRNSRAYSFSVRDAVVAGACCNSAESRRGFRDSRCRNMLC